MSHGADSLPNIRWCILHCSLSNIYKYTKRCSWACLTWTVLGRAGVVLLKPVALATLYRFKRSARRYGYSKIWHLFKHHWMHSFLNVTCACNFELTSSSCNGVIKRCANAPSKVVEVVKISVKGDSVMQMKWVYSLLVCLMEFVKVVLHVI